MERRIPTPSNQKTNRIHRNEKPSTEVSATVTRESDLSILYAGELPVGKIRRSEAKQTNQKGTHAR